MISKQQLIRTIQETLRVEWDPIGVSDVPAANDEYDQYVEPIAAMLATGASTTVIADHLLWIESEVMGLARTPDRALRVATRLQALAS